MFLRVTFSAAFSLLFLKVSGAAKSFVPPFQRSSKIAQLQQQRPRRLSNSIRRRTDEDQTCPPEPGPELFYEGDDFLLDLFLPEYQPVCSCGEPSGIDLAGFFADNPMPANQDELQGWADIFNNDFLGDFRHTQAFGCSNQCSFCLTETGGDDCVLLEVSQGGVATTTFFEGFTVAQVTAIAAAPEDSVEMVDRMALVSMESQFFRKCYTFTQGEGNEVCYTSGESLKDFLAQIGGVTPFCTVSVDGVDCLSCDDPNQDGVIVADCTNIPGAPAMLDVSAGNLSGIYAPLPSFSVYSEDNIAKTFGSCPAEEEPETEAAPTTPVVDTTTAPVVDTTTTPVVDTTTTVAAPAPDDEDEDDVAPPFPPVDTSGASFVVSFWTVIVAGAMFLL